MVAYGYYKTLMGIHNSLSLLKIFAQDVFILAWGFRCTAIHTKVRDIKFRPAEDQYFLRFHYYLDKLFSDFLSLILPLIEICIFCTTRSEELRDSDCYRGWIYGFDLLIFAPCG